MKIHGLVWVIAGAVILGVSYAVGSGDDLQKFTLFIWAGIGFIVYGLIKIIIGLVSRPKKAKVAKENYPEHQPKHNKQKTQATGSHVKFCPNCGGGVRHFDKFCYKCGTKMA